MEEEAGRRRRRRREESTRRSTAPAARCRLIVICRVSSSSPQSGRAPPSWPWRPRSARRRCRLGRQGHNEHYIVVAVVRRGGASASIACLHLSGRGGQTTSWSVAPGPVLNTRRGAGARGESRLEWKDLVNLAERTLSFFLFCEKERMVTLI